METLTRKRFLLEKDHILPAYEQAKQRLGRVTQAMMEATTLVECFTVFGFQTEIKPNGDITITGYQETNQPFEMLFQVLAPYVTKGSYLSFQEDGESLKLRFDGKELEIEATL